MPLRVDVVERVEWTGANTLLLMPPGAHILISSEHAGYQGHAALEMIFHEASHFLAGRDSPLRTAIDAAFRDLGRTTPSHDAVHAALFYLTGEVVRRRLQESAGVDYTTFIDAHDLYRSDGTRSAAQSTWPDYLDGRETLDEAARAFVRALRRDPPSTPGLASETRAIRGSGSDTTRTRRRPT